MGQVVSVIRQLVGPGVGDERVEGHDLFGIRRLRGAQNRLVAFKELPRFVARYVHDAVMALKET
jgi:hypothetical protein